MVGEIKKLIGWLIIGINIFPLVLVPSACPFLSKMGSSLNPPKIPGQLGFLSNLEVFFYVRYGQSLVEPFSGSKQGKARRVIVDGHYPRGICSYGIG